jgi:ferredoxin
MENPARGGAMKITIDREECTSCTLCWSDCPQIFEENPDDGWSQIVSKYRAGGNPAGGEIPADLGTCAKDAAEACPVEIIHVS